MPLPKLLLPAEALLLQAGAFRFGTDVLGIRGGTMGLADRVAADDERKRLLVIHRHAAERLSNELCRKGRIGVAARPLRVHVDQAHVIGAHRPLDLLVAGVALIARPAAANQLFSGPQKISSGSQRSSRPKPKPNVLKPIDS